MADMWLPSRYLKKALPKGFFTRKLLTNKLNVKRVYLRALLTATTLTKREIKTTLYKVIDFYREKIETLKDEGVKAYKKEALNDEKLLKQRIENLVTWNEAQEQKRDHMGEYYVWLPSSSKEPDPLHQLKYGKVFRVGKGEFPAERLGCKCGALFLTDDEAKQRGL